MESVPGKVTAAEFVRSFAAIRQRAKTAPVYITNHGKDSHVLCSAEQFRALANRRESAGDEPIALDMVQLSAWIDQGLILIDRAGHVIHINTGLLATARCDPAQVSGRHVFEAFPEFTGTLAEPYLRRAMELHEVALFEMQSPFQHESWLQCRLAPVGGNIALLIRDITQEVHQMRMTDEREEVLRAMEFNEDVAFVRLSLRAYIERVSAGFIALVGLPADRLIGLHFCNLIDFKMRSMVSDELEQVLGKGEGRNICTRLLNDRGALIAVRMGIVATRGGYCREGAAIVVSRTGETEIPRQPSVLRQVR